jgi:allophanate hydrolase subunit 1
LILRQTGRADIRRVGRDALLFDGVRDVDALEVLLAGRQLGRSSSTTAPAGAVVEVPTRYDRPDLDEVARPWDMTRDEAVQTHTSASYPVAFCGFAPGFALRPGERVRFTRR